MSDIHTKYIAAERYEILNTYEGPFSALRRLQKDVGSTASIRISHYQYEPGDAEPVFSVSIPDISIAFGEVKEREIPVGAGITADDAASFLLIQFLQVKELSFARQKKDSFLAVGEIGKDPNTIIHVVRPVSTADSNLVRLSF